MSHIVNSRPIGIRQTPPPLPRDMVIRGRNGTLIGGTVAVNGVWYKPVELLGKGGDGSVYRAVSAADQRSYALKVARPGDSILGEAEMLRSICRIDPDDSPEAAMIKSSQAHPSIIKYVAHNDGCLVMECVKGRTVSAQIKQIKNGKEPPLLLSELLRHMIAVCQGLAFAGCAHYDIKPRNLLLGEKREIRIADWGAASMAGDTPASFCYSDPSQILGKGIGWRADQYALAVTAYEWATGVNPVVPAGEYSACYVPFIGDKRDPRFAASQAFTQWMYDRHLYPNLTPHKNISHGLLQILRIMTAKNPQGRFGTWEEVVGALEQVAA